MLAVLQLLDAVSLLLELFYEPFELEEAYHISIATMGAVDRRKQNANPSDYIFLVTTPTLRS